MRSDKRILIITPSYKPAYSYGGTIFSVAALAEALAAKTFCSVFTSNADGQSRLAMSGRKTVDNVEVQYFHSFIAKNIHFVPSMYWKVLLDRKSTVIHVQSWWNLVAIPISIIALLKGRKLVISPRGMLSPYSFEGKPLRNLFQKLIGNWILRKAVIHATSEQERNQILNLNTQARVEVIPNILPLLPFRQRVEDADAIFEILFISRIHPKKNLELVMKTLTSLPNVMLRIVGDGDRNYIASLKLLANQLNVSTQINWHGPEYDADKKADLFAHASLFVLLSHDENFANNVVEALMCNCPVLVSSKVGMATFILEHQLGWIHRENEMNLDKLILQIQNDKTQRDSISKRARLIAIDHFLADGNIDKYLALYE